MPMHITLNDKHRRELTEAAHHCSLPPEKLAQLFVEDGLALYRRSPDEFKGTLDGENQ
jgi:hypothetical protein